MAHEENYFASSKTNRFYHALFLSTIKAAEKLHLLSIMKIMDKKIFPRGNFT